MRHNSLYLILSFFVLTGCKYFKKGVNPTNERPLARVNDDYLYYSDIKDLVKGKSATKDSAEIVGSYINDWIRQKLVLQKALTYLPPEKLNIEKQINDYRESLILYLYEKELILQKLDTVISYDELRSYFDEYKDNFELKHDVVQFFYVKVANEAPKIDSLKLWLADNDEADKIKLEDYCFQYAEDFSISDTTWFEAKMIHNEIPISEEYFNTLCRYRNFGFVHDSTYSYFIKVNDFKQRGEIAPFNYVASDITKILLNKRKLKLINDTYESVYNEALRSNDFEIYK